MQLSYRGSVNRWECDENDHLNVRFYLARHFEILAAGLAGCGLEYDSADLGQAIGVQHIRFLRESRVAQPLSGYFGMLSGDVAPQALSDLPISQAYTELRDSETGEVLCTCIHDLNQRLQLPRPASELSLPGHGAPRGVSTNLPSYLGLTKDRLRGCGFEQIGLGMVNDEEVGCSGHLLLHNYMGRLSDAMPHLWARLGDSSYEQSKVAEGGAVLEYCLRYHQVLKRGGRFGIYSGLLKTSPKVQTFAHLIYDEASEALVASAESCGVRMDLEARRAITLSPERLGAMQKHLLKV